MSRNKPMKPGYQGKHDSMREFAEKLMGPSGHAPDTYFSKSAADKEKVRPFKNGGEVKKRESDRQAMERHRMERGGATTPQDLIRMLTEQEEGKAIQYKEGGVMKKTDTKTSVKTAKKCSKFAMGGVAKIRHDQSTADGKQKATKKSSTKTTVYY